VNHIAIPISSTRLTVLLATNQNFKNSIIGLQQLGGWINMQMKKTVCHWKLLKPEKKNSIQSKAETPANMIRRHAFLLLWPWPWPNDLDKYLKMYLHTKMNFLGESFQKFEHYGQTDTQTNATENITTTVVENKFLKRLVGAQTIGCTVLILRQEFCSIGTLTPNSINA